MSSQPPSASQRGANDFCTIIVRGESFQLDHAQIHFDAPNFFSNCFSSGFAEATTRVLRLHRSPTTFAIIVDYLSGYPILPLATHAHALPQHMDVAALCRYLLEDARFYELQGLCDLLTMPKPPIDLLWTGYANEMVSLWDVARGELPEVVVRQEDGSVVAVENGLPVLAYARDVVVRPSPSFKPVHSIGIVNLARLTGAHDLLPIALYECCSLEAIELIGGFLRDDGTRESLSDNDIALCMRAQAALAKAHVERAISLTMATLCVPGHQPLLACKPALETLSYNNLTQIGTKVNAKALAARPWQQQQQVPGVPTICVKCLGFLQRHDAAQRQQIWNSLPRLVGVTVENWKQLEVKPVPQAAVPPMPQVQGVGIQLLQ